MENIRDARVATCLTLRLHPDSVVTTCLAYLSTGLRLLAKRDFRLEALFLWMIRPLAARSKAEAARRTAATPCSWSPAAMVRRVAATTVFAALLACRLYLVFFKVTRADFSLGILRSPYSPKNSSLGILGMFSHLHR